MSCESSAGCSGRAVRIAIVSYMGYDGPGVMHAHHFANRMVAQGHQVLMLLNGYRRTVRAMIEPPRYSLAAVNFDGGLLRTGVRRAVERFRPEIVHLWTPRHLPVRVGLEARDAGDARLLIHYEDDEEFLLAHFGGGKRFAHDDLELCRFCRGASPDPDDLRRLSRTLDVDFLRTTILEPATWNWLHPVFSPIAEKLADGYTTISSSYRSRLEERGEKPVRLLYPGVDLARFRPSPQPADLLRDHRLQDRTVFLYSGAIADVHDFPLYLKALPAVVARHPQVVLVQIGRNHMPAVTSRLVREGGLGGNVLFLDQVPHRRMPDHLALAHAFLAHVRFDDFNRHRLPSKIPEYMAMGRPMVVADHGFGTELEHGREAVKLSGDSAGRIAEGLLELLARRESWDDMGARSRSKAAELFDWERNTRHLTGYYEELLAQRRCDRREGLGEGAPAVGLSQLGYPGPAAGADGEGAAHPEPSSGVGRATHATGSIAAGPTLVARLWRAVRGNCGIRR